MRERAVVSKEGGGNDGGKGDRTITEGGKEGGPEGVKNGAKGGRGRGGGVGSSKRLEAREEVGAVRVGQAETLDVCEGGRRRRHVGGEFGINRGKIVLDMCMDKVGKETRDG